MPQLILVRDTVSSVGLIRGDVFLSTSSSAAHACHFRHALALDELRVKFMPEYFNEMNERTKDGRSKYIVPSLDAKPTATPASERRESTVSDSDTGTSGGKKNKTPEIKEVWFAGSHSDVWVRLRDPLLCTDVLRSEVVRIGLEHLIRPGTSPCCGCVEKRLQAVSCCSRQI